MTALPSLSLHAVILALLVACWTDVTSYRIPNWIPLIICVLFLPFAVAGDLPFETLIRHGIAFAVTFAAGITLFAWNKLGGGDAKLLAAVALWTSWDASLVILVVLTALIGGALSLALLACRSTHAGSFLRAHGCNLAIFDPETRMVPYGVAISSAFIVLTTSSIWPGPL